MNDKNKNWNKNNFSRLMTKVKYEIKRKINYEKQNMTQTRRDFKQTNEQTKWRTAVKEEQRWWRVNNEASVSTNETSNVCRIRDLRGTTRNTAATPQWAETRDSGPRRLTGWNEGAGVRCEKPQVASLPELCEIKHNIRLRFHLNEMSAAPGGRRRESWFLWRCNLPGKGLGRLSEKLPFIIKCLLFWWKWTFKFIFPENSWHPWRALGCLAAERFIRQLLKGDN